MSQRDETCLGCTLARIQYGTYYNKRVYSFICARAKFLLEGTSCSFTNWTLFLCVQTLHMGRNPLFFRDLHFLWAYYSNWPMKHRGPCPRVGSSSNHLLSNRKLIRPLLRTFCWVWQAGLIAFVPTKAILKTIRSSNLLKTIIKIIAAKASVNTIVYYIV